MWRWFRTILVLLLLGAVVNVAMAWTAVLRSGEMDSCGKTYAVRSGPWPEVLCRSSWGSEIVVGSMWVTDIVTMAADGTFVLTQTEYPAIDSGRYPFYPDRAWWDGDIAPGDSQRVIARAAGWPCWALRGYNVPTEDDKGRVRSLLVLDISSWPKFLRGDYGPRNPLALAVQPIWPGFLVNTVFYAAILLVLYCGSRFAHARVRSWRGRCSSCGYPRGQSSICSECGAAVKPLVTSAPPHASPPSS